MIKKKTSKKQSFSLKDIPKVTIKNRDGLSVLDPDKYFRDESKVAQALLQCLKEGDAEAFMEILDAYLSVNRKRVSEREELARSTIQQAFSKKGNPTLRTIAKIVQGSVADQVEISAKTRHS